MNIPSSISDVSPFFRLMESLDSAFMNCHDSGEDLNDDWGTRFFAAMEKHCSHQMGSKTAIYVVASQILYDFAFREDAQDLASAIYHNPKSLLRMIVLLEQVVRF